jgi:hypothetical protein
MQKKMPKRSYNLTYILVPLVILFWLCVVSRAVDYIGDFLGWGATERGLLFFGLPFAVVVLALIAHEARIAHRRRKMPRPGFCPVCGYCLVENETGKCPECGTSVEVFEFVCGGCNRKVHLPVCMRGRIFDCPHCAAIVELISVTCETCEREVLFSVSLRGQTRPCPHCGVESPIP